jgi:hypothetical protein
LFRKYLWLAISAVALGLSVASKYIYAVAGIAIVIHYLWRMLKRPLGQSTPRANRLVLLLTWGVFAVLVFFFADPYLWVKTPSRLIKSLTFSVDYSQGEHVASFNYPIWQPLVWLTKSVPQHPYDAIPTVPDSFWLQPDLLIALLVPFGLPRLIQRRGPYAAWLLTGLLFLFLWNTKWPQYVMVIVAPWCLCASEGVAFLVALLRKAIPRRKSA